MVELDVLEALDCLQWLRTGEEVAKRFAISQPTVSRNAAKALRVFGLEMERVHGEWQLIGDQTFLNLERQVHQMARRLGHRRLRLDATYWSAPTLCEPLPEGWLLGASNIVGIQRNFALLQDRVMDAWLTGLPDLPTASEPDLTAIVLSKMPVFFVCSPGHPLLAREQIDYGDIAEFPTLALPAGSYPKVETALKSIQLWDDGVRMRRYCRDKWEGRSEAELVVGYGTPLSMAVSGGQLCRLPLELPFKSGDALVVRRDWLDDPRLDQLIQQLRNNLAAIAPRFPELEMLI